MVIHSYKQPEKDAVRHRILAHAVATLTRERTRATIVVEDELREILDFALGILNPVIGPVDLGDEWDRWHTGYSAIASTKKPADLKVLYLCGPEPLNDLSVFVSLGVEPHNVWAVESHEASFDHAIKQLQDRNIVINVHRGALSEFFEIYDDAFDVVYLDACGTFPLGKPNTIDPLLKLLANGRLHPLSVLITNYAAVSPELSDRMTRIMSAYFRYRYRDLPKVFWDSGLPEDVLPFDDRALQELITTHSSAFYSDFITRFIIDLARFWIPNCKALAADSVFTSLFARSTKRKNLEDPAPAYMLASFLRDLREIKPDEPIASLLGNLSVRNRETGRFVGAASVLHEVCGDLSLLSDRLSAAIKSSWFDTGRPFTCDVPLPNLVIHGLLGKYGFPLFPNVRRSLRLQYKAKDTWMYTDVLVLDQCRYLFDWFPTIDLVPTRFRSLGFQVLARSLFDRLGRMDKASDTNPFSGAAVASWLEVPSAEFYNLTEREVVTLPENN